MTTDNTVSLSAVVALLASIPSHLVLAALFAKSARFGVVDADETLNSLSADADSAATAAQAYVTDTWRREAYIAAQVAATLMQLTTNEERKEGKLTVKVQVRPGVGELVKATTFRLVAADGGDFTKIPAVTEEVTAVISKHLLSSGIAESKKGRGGLHILDEKGLTDWMGDVATAYRATLAPALAAQSEPEESVTGSADDSQPETDSAQPELG